MAPKAASSRTRSGSRPGRSAALRSVGSELLGPKAKTAAAPKKCALKAQEPSPQEIIQNEAKEEFERFANDEGVMKLVDFSKCISAMNAKKCMIFGDHPGPTVKEEWKKVGGFEKREIDCTAFVSWWPSFLDLVKARVEEIETAEAARQAAKEAAEAAKRELYNSTGVWHVPLKALEEATNEAYLRGKTPLIIDDREDHPAETFYTYRGAHIIECKKMIMDKAKKTDVADILNEARDRFMRARCFKFGQTAVIRLSNTACHLRDFHNETFPSLSLLDAKEIAKVMGSDNASNFKSSPFAKMPESADDKMECELMGVHEKFRVIAITHFSEESYAEYLAEALPLHMMQPIRPMTE